MTRDEAIKELKWIQNIYREIRDKDSKELDITCAWIKHWENVNLALDMAINSLEVDKQYQLDYEHVEYEKGDANENQC